MTVLAPKIYQAIVIAKALKLYHSTKIKASRMYTPKNMLATATKLTGKEFKRGQYMEAHDALMQYADELKNVAEFCSAFQSWLNIGQPNTNEAFNINYGLCSNYDDWTKRLHNVPAYTTLGKIFLSEGLDNIYPFGKYYGGVADQKLYEDVARLAWLSSHAS